MGERRMPARDEQGPDRFRRGDGDLHGRRRRPAQIICEPGDLVPSRCHDKDQGAVPDDADGRGEPHRVDRQRPRMDVQACVRQVGYEANTEILREHLPVAQPVEAGGKELVAWMRAATRREKRGRSKDAFRDAVAGQESDVRREFRFAPEHAGRRRRAASDLTLIGANLSAWRNEGRTAGVRGMLVVGYPHSAPAASETLTRTAIVRWFFLRRQTGESALPRTVLYGSRESGIPASGG
jgi:hypothetical protein